MYKQFFKVPKDHSMTDLLQRKYFRSYCVRIVLRETTPEEVCSELIAKIDRYDSKTGAFLKLDREGALIAAQECSKRFESNLWPEFRSRLKICISTKTS